MKHLSCETKGKNEIFQTGVYSLFTLFHRIGFVHLRKWVQCENGICWLFEWDLVLPVYLFMPKFVYIQIFTNYDLHEWKCKPIQFNSKKRERPRMNEWNKEEGEQIKIHTKYCLNRTPSQWSLNSMYFISNFVFTIYLCCVYRVYLCVCGVIHWLPLILFSLYMLFIYRWRNIQKYSVSFHHWFEHTAKSWYKIANENLNDSKIK